MEVQVKVMADLKLNGKSFTQEMKYFAEGNSITINGQTDMVNWVVQGFVDALNKVCLDLHTWQDGKSVLWSVRDIGVVSILNETSNIPCRQL